MSYLGLVGVGACSEMARLRRGRGTVSEFGRFATLFDDEGYQTRALGIMGREKLSSFGAFTAPLSFNFQDRMHLPYPDMCEFW